MDQMADEMTLRAEERDKGSVNTAEESSARVRGERLQSEGRGPEGPSEHGCAGTAGDRGAQQPNTCGSSSSSLFSLKTFRASSSSTDSLSSGPTNKDVDCAEMVLSCLFCHFYDLIRLLPASCETSTHNCCPSYRHVDAVAEATRGSDEDVCIDLDCGLFSSCQDASDCLELAMEVSEICYH
ncbi:myoD family inhibitor domain-containing protein 2 [Takifugu flavidus]|uniref:MyoD family inhibitor domain-containing protein 2 n=1 Tax=Takifugu flavidus TaxID=433684 RepID=A0A5C6N2Z9_9TELE|nr:myoD family inhibitor domain-containing protein 2 [Takifugu flavidus]TWW61515.1 MyoD family inhibitor domain-containing protein 2 [Takifugu flavidus]